MEENYYDIEKAIRQAISGEGAELPKVMTELQSGRLKELPKAESYIKALNPKLHDIMDPVVRPDKMVNVDPDSPEYGSTRSIMVNQDGTIPERYRIERVARIALALQKLVVNRAVGITFGNNVKYKSTPETDGERNLAKAIANVLKDNKEPSLNRNVARQIYGLTEVAERWYVVEGKDEHKMYSGNPTKLKIKVQVFSPKYGDILYPYFDDDRNLTAFSRQYSRKNADGVSTTYFETYTAESFYLWGSKTEGTSKGNWTMMEGYPKPNPYGKIPVIYGCQDEPEYADVQSLIDRLEKLLSNFADTNDYFASPKITVKGHVNSFCKKGEAGAIMELDPDAEINYLSWDQAPASVKTEFDNLMRLIHTITQTPDLSWDSVKGLNVSGVALKLMFMDAVLKVKDKEEIWIEYLTRRINLLKVMLDAVDVNAFGDAIQNLFVEPEIVPYIVLDEMERTNIELAMVGNKQLKSRRSAMVSLGIDNVDTELETIEKEEEDDNMFVQGEPTI